MRVKGRETPVTIYEPLLVETLANKQQLDAFKQALDAWRGRDFKAAARMFHELATQGDAVSAKFAVRADSFAAKPPAADWDGVNTLDSK